MSIVLGLNAKAYINLSGTWENPVWTLVPNFRDITTNLETGEADVTDRGGGGWRLTAPTLFDGTVEGDMLWNPGDAVFEAIKDAFFARSTVDMVFLDGLITEAGNEGLRADYSITNFTRTEPLEEALAVTTSFKPSNTDNTPVWYVSTT